MTTSFSRLRPWHAFTVVTALVAVIGLGFAAGHLPALYSIGGLVAIGLGVIIFRSPWIGVLLLAFFIPFERIGSYDISGVTIRPSQIVGVLLVLSAFFAFTTIKRGSNQANPIYIPLGLFVIACLCGLLNTLNLERSLLVFGFMLFTISLAAVLPLFVTSKERLRQLAKVFLWSYSIVILFGLYQFVGDLFGLPPALTGLRDLYTKEVLGFPRVQSTALEPLYFANYLLIPLSVLLALFLRRDQSLTLPKQLALLSIGGINLVLTVARGGYLAFAAAACVVVIVSFPRLFTLRNAVIAVVSVAIGAVALMQLIRLDVVSTNFLEHVSNPFRGASYNERVEMFEVAKRAWYEHPLVGVGPGGFGPYEASHPYHVPDHGWRIVNNEYLELLAENGLIGLSAMLILFAIVLVRSIKAFRLSRGFLQAVVLGLSAALIGILVQYNTFSILYIMHVWFTIGVLLSVQNIIFHESSAARTD